MEKGKKHHMEGTKEIEENIKKIDYSNDDELDSNCWVF